MAGAGGTDVSLDISDFDKGDADPIGSLDALNKVFPLLELVGSCHLAFTPSKVCTQAFSSAEVPRRKLKVAAPLLSSER